MVLIVEDEAVSRRALAQLLRMNGFETEAVGSAEEALEAVANGHLPDIALVDINLPGMSGVDLVQQLEASHPEVVPVFITASDDEAATHQQGPTRLLRKPLDMKHLLHVMRRIPVS